MRSLDPRERELIALKFFAGLDNAEIAAVIGVTEPTPAPDPPGDHQAEEGMR